MHLHQEVLHPGPSPMQSLQKAERASALYARALESCTVADVPTPSLLDGAASAAAGAESRMAASIDRLRVSVAEMEGSESKEEEKDATKKGTKRKRAPPAKGPCEHGVKYRSKCKVCSACPHGKWRRYCKECGGASICQHGRIRSYLSLIHISEPTRLLSIC